MKKLLILAYDFPPFVSVGGLRPWNWYRYLHRFGIYPVVVTRQWTTQFANHLDYVAPGWSDKTEVEQTDCGTLLHTPYKPNLANKILIRYGYNRFSMMRKIISAWYEVLQFLLITGPKSDIYKNARNYLKYNRVDAIIASGGPFVLFKYAYLLSRKFNIPWIADYRDQWVQVKNSGYDFLLKNFYPSLERKYVGSAAAIITVSTYIKKLIEQNIEGKEFYIIPNGFDPAAEKYSCTSLIEGGNLRIAMSGTIYNWHPWKSFISVLARFVQQNAGARVSLYFYGVNIADEIMDYVYRNYPALAENIIITGKLPHEKLLAEMAKAHAFLLFNYYSVMGTKIFDYLALRRPVLLCYGNDPQALKLKEKFYPMDEIEDESNHLQQDLIEATNSGIVARDEAHLSEILGRWKKEIKNNGFLQCRSHGIEQYSRLKQTERMAEVVHGLTDTPKP